MNVIARLEVEFADNDVITLATTPSSLLSIASHRVSFESRKDKRAT